MAKYLVRTYRPARNATEQLEADPQTGIVSFEAVREAPNAVEALVRGGGSFFGPDLWTVGGIQNHAHSQRNGVGTVGVLALLIHEDGSKFDPVAWLEERGGPLRERVALADLDPEVREYLKTA